MPKPMGYLLPEGDAVEEELECLIVFYPNRVEYRRALFGSLEYLGTWLAWETDTLKRGKDAAASWKAANEATWDCIEMATCETILELLEQIEKNTRTCCGESNYVTYQNNTVVTTVIVPGVGPDPTLYGETSVADWDEWLEYVCYHANLYVDDLIETAEKIDTAVIAGGYVLDFIAHLFSIVQWRMVEDLVPVNFSVIQAVFNALGEGAIAGMFSTLAADFEAARSSIVCALLQGTSLEDAVKAVTGTGLLWTMYYSHLDYETTTAIIYEGQLPGVAYLDPVKRDDCDCSPQIGEFWHYTEFPLGTQDGWVKNGSPIIGSAYGNPDWGWRIRYDGGSVRISVSVIRQQVGLSSGDPAQNATVLRVQFDYKCESLLTGDIRMSVNSSGTPYTVDFPPSLTWVTVDHILTVPKVCLYNGWCVQFNADGTGSGNHIYLDNIGVDFDAPV